MGKKCPSDLLFSPLCILSMGWRCIADAARFEEFNPLDIASDGFRITGMELLMSSVIACRLIKVSGFVYCRLLPKRGG